MAASPPDAFGEYEVVRLIARGGMGAVFEGRSRSTGASYAIKTILDAGDRVARDRFRREAELLARCDRHPGIVKVHALGETPDHTLYLVLELVSGETLDRLLAREAPFEPRRAAALALDMARALAFVHARGIVHRDLKPANVLLDAVAGGAPRLTDFGLATAREGKRLTQSGAFVGTILYCAPEQAFEGAVGPWSDVYSLGCILFEMLTGKRPIDSVDMGIIVAQLSAPEPFRGVRTERPSVPELLEWIVQRCLARRPGDRYADGSALANDLERWLSVGQLARPRAPSGRRRRVQALAAAAGVVVVATALVVGDPRPARSAGIAREETALARSALDRAERGVARVETSVHAALVAEARSHVDRASAELPRARGAAPELTAGVEAVARAVSVAEAMVLLGSGKPDRALATIDALQGPVLGASERLARLRALVALGRTADAESEATLLDAAPPRARAAAAELLGDARLARGDPRGAEAHFERALALDPDREPELRAKHGGAAALAGEDEKALGDLVALFPDIQTIPEDRAANALLAPLAAALYRRGLAATDRLAVARDLEIAWRLGPPPAEVAPRVARVWMSGFTGGRKVDPHKTPSEEELAALRRRATLVGRAVSIDPGVDRTPIFDDFAWTRLAFQRNDDRADARVVADALTAAWPDHPTFLWIAAKVRAGNASGEDDREGFELLRRAVKNLPPPAPGESPEIAELAQSIARLGRRLSIDLTLPESGIEPIRLAAERAGTPSAREDYERALRASRLPTLRGVIEGESLRVVSRTAGTVFVDKCGAQCSGKAQLAWRDARQGDALVLAFPATSTGPRRLALVFGEDRDGPVVKVSVNGAVVLNALDLGTSVAFPGPERLVDVALVAGENELRVEIVDRNPDAGRRFVVGLDYLRFVD